MRPRSSIAFAVSAAIAVSAHAGEASREEVKVLPKISVEESDPGYRAPSTRTALKSEAELIDIPQSITVVTQEQLQDQQLLSIGELVRYMPGLTAHQGENNRDEIIFRGNSSSSSFFVDGVRDDVQYYRDFYNTEQVEVLRGPNAMIFGRGGGGGVLNRVTKHAFFTPQTSFSVLGGSYGDKRGTIDVNQPLSDALAVRVNGVYEESDSFRHGVDDLKRYGFSPTLTYRPDERTNISLSYEQFRDNRTADRGITSFAGRPANVSIRTFYGDPDQSHVRALVNDGALTIEHDFGGFTIRNHTLYAHYDRGYQNFVPGATNATQTQVALSAYNNATERRNLFNQTDLNFTLTQGQITHRMLAGVELGRQLTDNFRNTGFFNNTVTSISVPFANPTISTPVTFRQSATDADNHLRTQIGAAYVQDELVLSDQWHFIGGLRFDRFDLEYRDNRSPNRFDRTDNLWSPRAGVVYKPLSNLAVYTSYSVSFLPSSGDQFSSLTALTEQAKPEKFSNYEVGAKWDVGDNLQLSSAIYRLDRTNTRSTDPNNPTAVIQTGATRTRGIELGLTGNVTDAWKIAAAYAYQDAYVAHGYNSNATTIIRSGQHVAQVPRNNVSLWNLYQVLPQVGLGLGIVYRSDMFASIDNTVRLPGFTRADAAAYYTLNEHVRLQANVENIFDRKYYVNADNNTNISPGAPLTVRVGVNATF
jgi:catecholate siderophore receptor